MAQTLAGKDQWYVVHVLSGQENKVRENILKRVKTEEMGDSIYDVLVPTERVSEIKKGKKSETTRKFFPGYLIVNMHLLDENNQLVGRTWYFVRDTPGVIGFAGTKDKPIPMRQSEVDSMLAQMKEREEKVKPKVSFEVGESVKVADGPFQNQTGIVEEIVPVHHQESAGCGALEESGQHRCRFERAKQNQSRQGHAQTSHGNREHQAQRPKRAR